MQTSSGRPRIAAVVVTYNRCALLEGCLDALIRQDRPLDEILVIDNASTDSTREMLKQKYAGKITHVRMEENLGGSGGFYEGFRLAYEKGYDWIWVMDDDVEPAADALKALVQSPAFDDHSVGVLASLVLDAKAKSLTPQYEQFNTVMAAGPDGAGWIPVANGHYKRFNPIMSFRLVVSKDSLKSPLIAIEGAGFLGVMIRRDAISSVGLPLKDLFLTWDDTEFIYRISRRFKAFLVPSSKILHRSGWVTVDQSTPQRFMRRGPGVPFAQAWRSYYYVRNEIFVRTRYVKPWLAPFIPVLALIRPLGATLVFYDHKVARCKLLLQAAMDGVRGRLGKRVSP
jgi:rhamnopyranosyl-N-acetylglucosaminyl-diphospho-decaprenol beta-1,3/1,4-galactofuranosyltransferase